MTTPPDPLADKLREALEEDAASDDDAALLARAIDGAASRLAQARVVSLAPRRRTSRTVRIALPLAAAFAAATALAAIYAGKISTEPTPSPAPAPSTPPPHEQVSPKPTAAAPQETATISVTDLPNAPPVLQTTMTTQPDLGPAELFKLANAERRAGDVEHAIDLYKTLIKRHPDAAESQASHVTLGSLLEKRGDAAGALAQFDAYLAKASGDGALSEEARVGRATALQRLGRAQEEKKAWEALLQHHPQTVHAARARERLDATP